MFQDLDCSPLQQDHYHCQQLTLSLSAPYCFFSTVFVRHTLTNPQSSLCLSLSLFHSTEMIYFVSPPLLLLLLYSSAALGVSAELHHSVWILNPHTGDARANTGE